MASKPDWLLYAMSGPCRITRIVRQLAGKKLIYRLGIVATKMRPYGLPAYICVAVMQDEGDSI